MHDFDESFHDVQRGRELLVQQKAEEAAELLSVIEAHGITLERVKENLTNLRTEFVGARDDIRLVTAKVNDVVSLLAPAAIPLMLRDGILYSGGRNELQQPHGYGTMTFPDGTTLEGEWSEGRPVGRCVQRLPDETTFTGDWSTVELFEEELHGGCDGEAEEIDGGQRCALQRWKRPAVCVETCPHGGPQIFHLRTPPSSAETVENPRVIGFAKTPMIDRLVEFDRPRHLATLHTLLRPRETSRLCSTLICEQPLRVNEWGSIELLQTTFLS